MLAGSGRCAENALVQQIAQNIVSAKEGALLAWLRCLEGRSHIVGGPMSKPGP